MTVTTEASRPTPSPQLKAACHALGGVLSTPGLTDVVLGPNGYCWYETLTTPLQRAGHDRLPEETCREIAVSLADLAGERLDDAHPWVDGIIPFNETSSSLSEAPVTVRLHAVLAPVAHSGTTVSLRILRSGHLRLRDLQESGMLSVAHCAQLCAALENRRMVVLAGATGTGKTTLLSALLAALPPLERVVCIEDTPELTPPHPQVVQLRSRPANTEGAGGVDLSTLVRQALRMRPDRLVIGEVRGAEIVDLLNALNTGHRGALTSIHANSCADVSARMLALALQAGIPEAAARRMIASSVDVIAFLERDRRGQRTVSTVTTLQELVAATNDRECA